jgi:uncharacterized protein DUF2470
VRRMMWQATAPRLAERARTITARGGRAALFRPAGDGPAERIEPALHHMQPNGSILLLVRDDDPVVAVARGQFATLVEIADRAPVPLRQPVRGLLWIIGWLCTLDGDQAREATVAVAEQRPDGRLLDVGHGLAALRFFPSRLVVADGDGAGSLRPDDVVHAAPDPFHAYENRWLPHLDQVHRDLIDTLEVLLPARLRGGHIRPLGVDRCGLRLRVESDDGDHDVRLAFSRSVYTPAQLAVELRQMVARFHRAETPTRAHERSRRR